MWSCGANEQELTISSFNVLLPIQQTLERRSVAINTSIHGAWCNARTIPMRCRYCGEDVFYFTCNCGCKVFFDALGSPWVTHNCLERHIATYGKEVVEDSLAQIMMLPGYSTRGLKIEREYCEQVRRQSLEDRKKSREIVAMAPPRPNYTHRDLGRLVELIDNIDLFRRANLELVGPIAFAMLGELGKQPMVQLTFLIDDLSYDDRESYTCFAPFRLVKSSAVKRGDLVEFKIVARENPSFGLVWLCEQLTTLF